MHLFPIYGACHALLLQIVVYHVTNERLALDLVLRQRSMKWYRKWVTWIDYTMQRLGLIPTVFISSEYKSIIMDVCAVRTKHIGEKSPQQRTSFGFMFPYTSRGVLPFGYRESLQKTII